MGCNGNDYRKEPHPGAGPYMGLIQTEFLLCDRVQAFLRARSADNECKHGSLPDDKVIRCKCWAAPKAEKAA